MLNQVVVVGRISHLDNNELDNELIITLVTPSAKEGEDDNILACTIKSKNMIENILAYVGIGDLIAIRGRIITGNKIIAEKTTFLNTKKEEDSSVSN